MTRPLHRLLIGLIVLAVGATGAAGQASVGASVQVLLAPTSGAGIRPLSFGNVPLGVTTSRPIASAADSSAVGVGHFNFTGVNGNRGVQLTFTLPLALTHSGSGNTMPVTFNGSFGLHCFDRQNGAHVCTQFNPAPSGGPASVIVLTPPPPPRNGTLRVYLGGAVMPGTSLSAGVYQGVVTLTMARI